MKRILIIGATSGIAKECARLWATRGDILFLVARDNERLKTLVTDLRVRGASDVNGYCVDLNNIDNHPGMLEAAEKTMFGIDTVLIAHGTLSDQKSCEQSVEETLAEIKTNTLSTISLLTLISNQFEKKQIGTISVISSVAGDRGRASNYVYGSSKAMITVFMSGLRQRLHKANVNILTIKPGFIDTPMTSSFKKGLLWTKPSTAASIIVRAIDMKKDEIYVPFFWWIVMTLIKIIPVKIFKKLSL